MSSTIQLQRPAELELSSVSNPTIEESRTDVAEGSISRRELQSSINSQEPPSTEALFSTSAIPDGGYGWAVVFCAATVTFWNNGMINCWGILQAALLNSTLSHTSTSTVSFVGSLNLASGVAFGLLATRLARRFGSRVTATSGVTLMGLGLIAAGWCTENIGALFVTIGLMAGAGMSGSYTITNTLPVQYFSGKLGLANGLVKLGGGIGGTVMAIALEALARRVGIAWTFRIQGCLTIATGLPAAWFMRDRVPTRNVPFVDLSMFRSVPFTAMSLAGAVGTFALFVPPYYLPLFAQSLGLSSSTGAALVSAFNACNALGRFAGGPLCDKIGSANTFVITMILNAVSMLAIWPVSSTLGPLYAFAILNGIANGAFFTVFPTVVATIFGPGRAAAAMSMSITGWTPGYLMGAPIAGYLLQAAGGQAEAEHRGISVFRPAIFYAGGVALASSVFALLARIYMAKDVRRRV
jgi:MFS family permease